MKSNKNTQSRSPDNIFVKIIVIFGLTMAFMLFCVMPVITAVISGMIFPN